MLSEDVLISASVSPPRNELENGMKHATTLAGLALLALTGCTSYHTERATQALVNPGPMGGPEYRTEWDVSPKKVTAEGTARVNFWVFTSGESKYADVPGLNLGFFPTDRALYKAKAAATYEACVANKADALLGVTYSYKITDYFLISTVECTVQGFPATVTGVKLLEDKPVLIDKTKEVIRIKPHETLIDCSGTPKIGITDYRTSGTTSPSATSKLFGLF